MVVGLVFYLGFVDSFPHDALVWCGGSAGAGPVLQPRVVAQRALSGEVGAAYGTRKRSLKCMLSNVMFQRRFPKRLMAKRTQKLLHNFFLIAKFVNFDQWVSV